MFNTLVTTSGIYVCVYVYVYIYIFAKFFDYRSQRPIGLRRQKCGKSLAGVAGLNAFGGRVFFSLAFCVLM
jgi:hypothetical protein